MGVSHRTTEEHRVRHRFYADGQHIGDVCKTIHVATEHAKTLGVDTSYDDWAEVVAESGEHWVEFTVAIDPSVADTPRRDQ